MGFMTESVPAHYIVPSKLSTPYLPPNAIERDRLSKAFIHACKSPLVVICAPAGFGKTTAVLHGLQALDAQSSDVKFAWLSLETEDSDPKGFAACFICAIQREVALSEQLVVSGVYDQNSQLKALLGQLLYELDRIEQRLVIVLDDYHLISSEPIHQALAYFARHLPPHVTLVLTTRSDPPASLMSLRLQGLVADLTSDDLGFTVSEAQSFFQQASQGVQLNEQDVTQLLDHVEGWAVGLQLIVLGLATKPSVEELKARLAHKDLNVIDYFDSEIFDGLSPEVKQFLLRTCIVNRFNEEIAEALTDNINVHEVIEYLQRQNLFIVQFNDPQQWFRYHHLLRDFLLHKLRVQSDEDVRHLHLNASRAFLKIGYIVGAVNHAISSQDQEQIINILRTYGDELIHKAHYGLVKRCLAELPEDIISADPKITLVCCWVEAIFGDPTRVERILKPASKRLTKDSKDQLMHAEYETVRSQAYLSRGLLDLAEQAAQIALDTFPANNTRRQSPLLTYANVKFEQGKYNQALAIYEESELLSRQEANHDAVLWSLYQQSQIWKQHCDFPRAIDLAREVKDYANDHNVNSGFNVFFSLYNQAEIALESYHLREAKLLINEVGLLCQNWNKFWTQHLFGWLLKLEMLKGKPSVAKDLAAQHESILAQENIAEHLIPYSMEAQLLYWWQCGETRKIKTWLKATPLIEECQSIRDYTILRAQLYGQIACQQFEQAAVRLSKVYSRSHVLAADQSPYLLEAIRLGLLNVSLLSLQGRSEQAEQELMVLIPIIHEKGIVASILYLRQWLMPVFESLEKEGLTSDQHRHVEQLLILYKQRNTTSRRGETEIPDNVLAKGVSKKEWRVLQYIMQGKSNEEIAQMMFIAVSTVKTHINNLYKKLSVANRKQAIKMGTELAKSDGLLL